MAKIKLVHFEVAALVEESKKLMEYLQRIGITSLENIENEQIEKYHTEEISALYEQKRNMAVSAVAAIEKYCALKKSFLQSFSDYSEIEYHDYKQLCEQVDELEQICCDVQALTQQIEQYKLKIVRLKTLIEQYRPWESLDIPMSSTRTALSSIFIGSFKSALNETDIKQMLAAEIPQTEDIEVQVVSASKLQTCAVIKCHVKQ